MRKPFIAANWKMNLSTQEIEKFVDQFSQKFAGFPNKNVEVALCAPFVYLPGLIQKVKQKNKEHSINIKTGAQNMHWEAKGAFTGEISGPMLKDIGCSYVILGHSERREKFKETDKNISDKAISAFKNGLLPIICVGETLEQREQNKTLDVVRTQMIGSLAGLTPAQVEACTIAYEPIWAIGTGKTASPEMAQEVHKMIRDFMIQQYGSTVSQTVCIQYGGSVKANNMQNLIIQPDIDGALVGGASLDPNEFLEIVRIVANTVKK